MGHSLIGLACFLSLALASWSSPGQADPMFKERQVQLLSQPLPPDLYLARQKVGTLFTVSYAPKGYDAVPLSTIHDWLVRVEPRYQSGTRGVALRVSADMPRHRHGMPTQATAFATKPGEFLVRGLEFHMPGWWRVTVCVKAGSQSECLPFDVLVSGSSPWLPTDLMKMQTLSLAALPTLPAEARRNSFVGKAAAIRLGEAFFFDKRLSKSGGVACATCHLPDVQFASPALVNTQQGQRSVPSLAGVGWGAFYFWDGRADALWSQAVQPLLNPLEHGMTPASVRRELTSRYAAAGRDAMGAPAWREVEADASGGAAVVLFGKAVAAFVSTLVPGETAFDRYVASLLAGAPPPPGFGACEQQGLGVFLGKGRCVDCHNGPRLTNDAFHNTGVPLANLDDDPTGRARTASGHAGLWCGSDVRSLDPVAPDCRHVTHARTSGMALVGAFKTPSLRGIRHTAPYMHNGGMLTLAEVVKHYERAAEGPVGTSELLPLTLSDDEERGLLCFLDAL